MRTISSARSRRPLAARRQHVRGMVLIEVLIALLIFMFGVLGLVGLQATVTRAQTDSKVRADAAFLASEMVGRLWSDMSNLSSYNGATCASTDRCVEWQTKVASMLPKGSGTVTITAVGTTGANATIAITWTGPDGQQHGYTTNTTIMKAS